MDFLQKVQQLPGDVRECLMSDFVRLELKKSVFSYGLLGDIVAEMAGPIGLIFVKDFSLRDLPIKMIQELKIPQSVAYGIAYEINQRIFNRFPGYFEDAPTLLREWQVLKSSPVVSEAEAYRKVIESEPWIIEAEKEKEEELEQARMYQEKLERILLLDALARYPRLQDTQLNIERISIKSERDTVRGTVRNWLRAYRDALGVRKHTALERGQFLFQSENGKLLSNEERERVSFVLKSLDDNTPIPIDPERQEIVFPVIASSQAQSQSMPAQPFTASTVHTNDSSSLPEDIFERRTSQSSVPLSPEMAPLSAPTSPQKPSFQTPSKSFNFSQTASLQPSPSQASTMRFSSGHTLPSERQEVQGGIATAPVVPSPFIAPVPAMQQSQLQNEVQQRNQLGYGGEATSLTQAQPVVAHQAPSLVAASAPAPAQYRMPPRIRTAHFSGGQHIFRRKILATCNLRKKRCGKCLLVWQMWSTYVRRNRMWYNEV